MGFLLLDLDLHLQLLLVLQLHLAFLTGRPDCDLERSVCDLGRSEVNRLMLLGLEVVSGSILSSESVLFSGNSLTSSSVANNFMSI